MLQLRVTEPRSHIWLQCDLNGENELVESVLLETMVKTGDLQEKGDTSSGGKIEPKSSHFKGELDSNGDMRRPL